MAEIVNTAEKAPMVTIMVATYNRANLIRKAIESAQKQSFKDWELLVLDDCSTDGTEKLVQEIVAADPRVRYIKQPQNVGIARNRNTCLEQARGAYIAPLDSDDIWIDDEKLAKQVAFLEANPDCALVGTNVYLIDQNGDRTGLFSYETDDAKIREKMLLRNQFAQSSVLYRLSAAREAGGYDGTYAIVDDYDLWLRMGLAHRFANLPDYTTDYRVHPGGITKEKRFKTAKEHLLVILKYKNSYPGFGKALGKALLRLLVAAAKTAGL